ncbi:tryptophan 7-halogenase [Pseudoalteromonas tunicata]|uniref:tryptophan halogenase family protein n=1 Tax=Pseudoalteromonas tunicata TaxID=314281 RepID=UPI00273E91AC|nr:tryptophan halogenase family protein [Pseudoalteromonas tunicata]MDP5211540.1 tryptophan 7-halogenase [Pseudoalteromonas tunicata]
MNNSIKKIVIVGGGTAGWMAAASLAKYVNNSAEICLIESSDIATVGVGEATLPNIVQFNRNLGIDETAFIKATQATFKLGIQFENWHPQNKQFFHPFADYGLKIDQVDFHHYLYRAQQTECSSQLADFSFACQLAKQYKFAQPHANPSTPLADYAYAYHFDAGLYGQFLKKHSINAGVNHLIGTIEQVNLHPDTGFINNVALTDGQIVEGELFIDCSGFEGLLIEKALHTGYEDWSHWLFCDSALAVQTTRVNPPEPFTRSIAQSAGWQWHIPLQHRSGNGYIYSSRFESDEQAKALLQTNINGEPLGEIRKITFKPGRRKQIWHKNCFALGLASGFLEPLESTSISLVQTAIAKLLTFFPDCSFNQADINEVNRLHNLELENISDFLILHYKLSARCDTPFWQACQNMAIPESLQHKIDLFKSRGHIAMYDQESFEHASWLTFYDAYQLKPRRLDPRAWVVPEAMLLQKLQQIQNSISEATIPVISHQAFITKHCAAKPLPQPA